METIIVTHMKKSNPMIHLSVLLSSLISESMWFSLSLICSMIPSILAILSSNRNPSNYI